MANKHCHLRLANSQRGESEGKGMALSSPRDSDRSRVSRTASGLKFAERYKLPTAQGHYLCRSNAAPFFYF
ncbi:hypothetical protein M5D96_004594 [Drosophila gunungcola]|uniref:Uncharacterized protein n=1 Tax=Drosophila gunungcola TaxID=103775 RepID=A0A9Q0BSS5_9MUSC|nr:hypothetical protein M5D96_004594 [Drosophila gunungcola]